MFSFKNRWIFELGYLDDIRVLVNNFTRCRLHKFEMTNLWLTFLGVRLGPWLMTSPTEAWNWAGRPILEYCRNVILNTLDSIVWKHIWHLIDRHSGVYILIPLSSHSFEQGQPNGNGLVDIPRLLVTPRCSKKISAKFLTILDKNLCPSFSFTSPSVLPFLMTLFAFHLDHTVA